MRMSDPSQDGETALLRRCCSDRARESSGITRPAAVRSAAKSFIIRMSSSSTRSWQPVDHGQRNAGEHTLQHGLPESCLRQPLRRVRPERGGEQPLVVGPDRILDDRQRGVVEAPSIQAVLSGPPASRRRHRSDRCSGPQPPAHRPAAAHGQPGLWSSSIARHCGAARGGCDLGAAAVPEEDLGHRLRAGRRSATPSSVAAAVLAVARWSSWHSGEHAAAEEVDRLSRRWWGRRGSVWGVLRLPGPGTRWR